VTCTDWRKVRLVVGLSLLGLVLFKLAVDGSPPTTPVAPTGRYREMLREAVKEYLAKGFVT
jgi:hypothetical protein